MACRTYPLSTRVGSKHLNAASTRWRSAMSSSMKDKLKGSFHEAKGRVREMVGKNNNDPELEAKGTVEKNMGKAQKKVGQIKKVLGV
jgi:uncharacterized protein YjbJ (UPF0337 family)